MAKIIQNCPECGKKYEQYSSEYREYCSVGCQYKKHLDHPPDCNWHKDWHGCNCGKFEQTNLAQDSVKIHITQLPNNQLYLPIPNYILEKLNWNEGDLLYIEETLILNDSGDHKGIIISREK